ncbi:MAG TPA: carboxypeptidase-like regulatory domain-containing protein [Kofleriaceae bacterium]|nr:carboxypeptidase-like regulatory domain-containing protein [Kofleriaceae bacterium]
MAPCSSRFLIGLALLSLAGCPVGSDSVPPPPATPDAAAAPAVDASGEPAVDGGGGGNADCTPREPIVNYGHHPERFDFETHSRGCKGGPCHNGTNGPAWTAAGAVYDRQESGGSPVGGAHVYITDSVGREFHTVTDLNGAFWFMESMSPPLQTAVSICPDRLEMPTMAPNGNCNGGSACHQEENKIFINVAE